jgi:peptidoglycan/LPS O-acetylase OafA/YrhL
VQPSVLPGSNPSTIKSGTNPAYRADVDGLRGIAVLSVIFYHAFPGRFRSGYVGVDIFFVISGFLISGIILAQLRDDTFRFGHFYSRRVRRIFPALLVILCLSLIFGWFVLLPDHYKPLGKHTAAAAIFSSNFVLSQETGYFGNAAETKPLLHLWSLGIEEQFYLVWPLALWSLWKRRLNIFVVCLLVIAGSFAINIRTVGTNTVFAFYSPFSRFWELTCGSLMGYLAFQRALRLEPGPTRRRTRRSIIEGLSAFSGLLLIGFAIWAIPRGTRFPGWWALFPTVGTCLVLAGGRNAWLNRVFLSNRVLVSIGLISYPLYLWHWPILAFARIYLAGTPSVWIRAVSLVASALLAWITYRWIERPIRFGAQRNATVLWLLALMAIVGCAGLYVFRMDGLSSRLGAKSDFQEYFANTPPEYRFAKKHRLFEAYRAQCDFFDNLNPAARSRDAIDPACYTPASDKSILIWGDSHAQHLYYGLQQTIPREVSILQVTTSSCLPRLTETSPGLFDTCTTSNRFAQKVIAEVKPRTVLLAQGSGHLSTNFEEIAKGLQSLGVRHVLVAGPIPQWSRDLYKIVMADFWESTPHRSLRGLRKDIMETDTVLKERYANNPYLTYVSLIDCFCNSEGCLLYLGDNRLEGLVTHDTGHLLPKASEFLSRRLLAPAIMTTFPELGPYRPVDPEAKSATEER